jgi:hypothetical protein
VFSNVKMFLGTSSTMPGSVKFAPYRAAKFEEMKPSLSCASAAGANRSEHATTIEQTIARVAATIRRRRQAMF